MAFKRVTCQSYGATSLSASDWEVKVIGTLEYAGDDQIYRVSARDEDAAVREAIHLYTLDREKAQGWPL